MKAILSEQAQPMDPALETQLLHNPSTLIHRIASRLGDNGVDENWRSEENNSHIKGSAVVFLLSQLRRRDSEKPELHLVLNKRSKHVLQPGDLCCPGGGLATSDHVMAPFMKLPFSPLSKWTGWRQWRARDPRTADRVALLLTTGLREAWEEMHLNPFSVAFLGPLPVQHLVLFERSIYPLVAWVPDYPRLTPNREVERIVHIPLRRLLKPQNYCCYRLAFKDDDGVAHRRRDFPCYVHHGRHGTDILWGATFRITMDFLKIVFGFRMPEMKTLPVIEGRRRMSYLNGSSWNPLRGDSRKKTDDPESRP
jgi:8-oxo-dGTP pyrophosphatase MutT (NUDIX family)